MFNKLGHGILVYCKQSKAIDPQQLLQQRDIHVLVLIEGAMDTHTGLKKDMGSQQFDRNATFEEPFITTTAIIDKAFANKPPPGNSVDLSIL